MINTKYLIYTTFYLRILRLSITNTNLLEIYSLLLRRSETMGELWIKNNLLMRKGLRESIKIELEECIGGSYFENKKCPINKLSISCLLSFVRVDTFLQDFLYIKPSEWDKCCNCELDNVSQYYNVLYTEDLPRNITDLLLGQKEKIESYLIDDL